MTTERATARAGTEVREVAAAFARPTTRQGVVQLLTSFGPFVIACAAMYLVFPMSRALTLLLAVPAGMLLVRVFIVQHDCGHGSFFASRRANRMTGRLCSLMTLTPFANWGRQHRLHHADWNNLDRGKAGGSDIYSACMTVRDYRALTRRQRLLYRLPRHPLIANVLLPPIVFVLIYRVPFDTPRDWVRERWSVYFTNIALTLLFVTLAAIFGWQRVLLVHLPIMVVASILGVWLFSVQHRFEAAHWTGKDDWNFVDAALQGASWLDLPRLLHWLTGNIGFHHVHHLDPRVPSYRLSAAHDALHAAFPLRPVSLAAGLGATSLTLWDEASGRLVRFRDVDMSSNDGPKGR